MEVQIKRTPSTVMAHIEIFFKMLFFFLFFMLFMHFQPLKNCTGHTSFYLQGMCPAQII